MSRSKFILIGLFSIYLGACSSDIFLVRNGNMPDEQKIAEVKTGQTKEQVEALLGTPSIVSTLDQSEWIYMSSTVRKVAFFTPKVVSRDILSIDFDKNGKVATVTMLNQENGENISIDKDKTSSGGHDIGFFKKYFGGVGTYSPFGSPKQK